VPKHFTARFPYESQSSIGVYHRLFRRVYCDGDYNAIKHGGSPIKYIYMPVGNRVERSGI
jgi:hypothetical protein